MPTMHVHSQASLAHATASWLTEQAIASVQQRGGFNISLTGGSTPKAMYELLATPEFSGRFPWSQTHVFFGDERYVPHDHPSSNYRMAREALLSHVPLPAENVHPFPVGTTPEADAASYAETLQQAYGNATLNVENPLFDVMLLGLGDDGHVASLFPGHLALNEHEKWAVPVVGAKPEARLSLTFPVLNSSRHTVFLVSGAAKADAVSRVLEHDPSLPGSRIATKGQLHWFLDTAAAGKAVA